MPVALFLYRLSDLEYKICSRVIWFCLWNIEYAVELSGFGFEIIFRKKDIAVIFF